MAYIQSQYAVNVYDGPTPMGNFWRRFMQVRGDMNLQEMERFYKRQDPDYLLKRMEQLQTASKDYRKAAADIERAAVQGDMRRQAEILEGVLSAVANREQAGVEIAVANIDARTTIWEQAMKNAGTLDEIKGGLEVTTRQIITQALESGSDEQRFAKMQAALTDGGTVPATAQADAMYLFLHDQAVAQDPPNEDAANFVRGYFAKRTGGLSEDPHAAFDHLHKMTANEVDSVVRRVTGGLPGGGGGGGAGGLGNEALQNLMDLVGMSSTRHQDIADTLLAQADAADAEIASLTGDYNELRTTPPPTPPNADINFMTQAPFSAPHPAQEALWRVANLGPEQREELLANLRTQGMEGYAEARDEDPYYDSMTRVAPVDVGQWAAGGDVNLWLGNDLQAALEGDTAGYNRALDLLARIPDDELERAGLSVVQDMLEAGAQAAVAEGAVPEQVLAEAAGAAQQVVFNAPFLDIGTVIARQADAIRRTQDPEAKLLMSEALVSNYGNLPPELVGTVGAQMTRSWRERRAAGDGVAWQNDLAAYSKALRGAAEQREQQRLEQIRFHQQAGRQVVRESKKGFEDPRSWIPAPEPTFRDDRRWGTRTPYPEAEVAAGGDLEFEVEDVQPFEFEEWEPTLHGSRAGDPLDLLNRQRILEEQQYRRSIGQEP
ncbi:MAG: hypothetical protein GY913_21425 [Proteobacteria bacterium]|nr:hypothetical protein [Actinomycetes bacterium]MCP4919470.1 hypothetical protein [Pseudomonadota bacterium]